MKQHFYPDRDSHATCFAETDDNVWLDHLFGLRCGAPRGEEGLVRGSELISLSTDSGAARPDSLKLKETAFAEDHALLIWNTSDESLNIKSAWKFSASEGIWSRTDTLSNESKQEITIRRYLAKFSLNPGRYELFSQGSSWCNENEGQWQTLTHGSVVLGCEGGRTTQGGTPYLCIRKAGDEAAVVFHIIPSGNWVIRITAETAGGDSPPFAVVELGMADKDLSLVLSPGETLEIPQVLIQTVPEGKPHLAAPHLHRFLLQNHFVEKRELSPIVYNTWFDDFDSLAVPRLRRQLAAAKEIGCEIFVIDAGWYGGGDGNWAEQTGDWREKTNAAFEGHMAEFADEVRATGLGFGLWMEPERLCPSVPIRLEHPDWFLPGSNDQFYPNLSNDVVAAYIHSEMSRLIETYHLAWMKVDFNFRLGVDPTGSEFHSYFKKWYEILDNLREEYPDVFLEGCASGGMRLDMNTASHFNGHFLSDDVNPWDVLEIYHGAIMRLLPGRIAKWAVLRSVGKTVPVYGTPLDQCKPTLVTPAGSGATWDRSETADLDFVSRAALPGIFGLSGDIAGLPSESRLRLRHHAEFFKEWRLFIAGSVAHLLTPPQPKSDRSGWVAVQLQDPQGGDSLIFVYRLKDPANTKVVRLQELNSDCKYRVVNDDEPAKGPRIVSGCELMNTGLSVDLARRNTAAVFIVAAI